MRWQHFCTLYEVPKRYTIASVSTLLETRSQEVALRWIKKPISLLLQGPPGRGKTHFMHALIRGILETNDISAIRFIRSKQLDDRLLKEFREYGTSQDIIKTISDVQFLFLDDFGMERSTERTERDYYDIFDQRVANDRVTVISTNLTEQQILDFYGGRIESRLRESALLEFKGCDLRTSPKL